MYVRASWGGGLAEVLALYTGSSNVYDCKVSFGGFSARDRHKEHTGQLQGFTSWLAGWVVWKHCSWPISGGNGEMEGI